MNKLKTIGVIGAGAMGSGIAQVAATAGHEVILHDNSSQGLKAAMEKLNALFDKLVAKGKYSQEDANAILERITPAESLEKFKPCGLVIEAIIENLKIKQSIFHQLEDIVDGDCILASNTSSLSIASIASACDKSGRVVGIHFFNPAPLMPLVEIIPCLVTDEKVTASAKALIDSWGKTTVLTKDTPGFIVNRVARPFYGESIRIFEEGVADFATIDWAMKEIGGFRMGPFELMDYIGNDINFTVTETVFQDFFYDPRYRPSFTQKRLFESKLFGRKSGRGYYDYREGAVKPVAKEDKALGELIVNRVTAMLMNEAVDALFLNIGTKEDLDLAMTKGVNYPKGLLAWADEIGLGTLLQRLEDLQEEYGEDRYRPSPLLKRMVKNGSKFYN
ncbi:MAG: 3-hydroxybutyryl-CoA dehydrogenase [Sphingobacteriales bacterium]|jgi:3-hydroxybutyryl-CoA dehydrogenase